MDLRAYYKKIREVESTLSGPYVVLMSLSTSDGGREGVLTEATRQVAAKQIAELRARLATQEEAKGFHSENARSKREREEAEQMNRVQFVMMPQKTPVKQAKE